MNNLFKVLIGVGVVGAVAATTYVVTKKSEEKSIDIPEEENQEQETEEKAEPKDFVEMIKIGAMKKATKFLAWVILNKDKIEAFGTVIGIVAGVLGVINAVKEYSNGKKLHENLDFLHDKIDLMSVELDCIEHIITEGA